MAMIVTNSYKFASVGSCRPVSRSDTAFPHNELMRYEGFSKRLRLACEAAGVPATQPVLARLFGVSTTIIWHYLNGEKLPSMAKAILISTKLGVCVEWLLTGRGPMTPAKNQTDMIDASQVLPEIKKHIVDLVAALSKQATNE